MGAALAEARPARPFATAALLVLLGYCDVAAEVEAHEGRALVRGKRLHERGGGALERGAREALATAVILGLH